MTLSRSQKIYMGFKRCMDFLIALVALILFWWVLAILCIAIKIDSPGPIFFKQKRVGLHKTHFNILKFRTMRIDTPKDMPTHMLSNPDQYITKVGKFLRKSSLDELPQIINILKGEMSIVGPRPERPEIAEQYEEIIPACSLRLQVKAGLTGYAQIYGRYNTAPYDKLLMDLMYINKMSIFEDLKLMFATVKILFMKESTSGVESGQTTAVSKKLKKKEEKNKI